MAFYKSNTKKNNTLNTFQKVIAIYVDVNQTWHLIIGSVNILHTSSKKITIALHSSEKIDSIPTKTLKKVIHRLKKLI